MFKSNASHRLIFRSPRKSVEQSKRQFGRWHPPKKVAAQNRICAFESFLQKGVGNQSGSWH
jgi:hypothetical protein